MSLNWYVVHAYSNFEHKVANSLKERIKLHGLDEKFGEVLVPTEEVVEMRAGQKRRSERKFFPGYVLVRMEMSDETWHLVQETPRITGFVGGRTHPTPLSDAEVEEIVKATSAEEGPRPRVRFHIGESVRITDGPFTDFNGVVEEVMPDKGKVRVSVSLFGRPTSVELDYLQLRAH